MGANNSTRRVSFESDENENITVVKGIRLSENVIKRMKEPATPPKQQQSAPTSATSKAPSLIPSPPLRPVPPLADLASSLPRSPPFVEPVAPPAPSATESVATPPPKPPTQQPTAEPLSPASVPEPVAVPQSSPVSPPAVPPAVNEEALRKITDELRKDLAQKRAKAEQDMQAWYDAEKARASAQAQADAQAKVQEELSRILSVERALTHDSLQQAIIRERISSEDEKLRAQLLEFEQKAKQLAAKEADLKKQDAFYREQVARLGERSAQFYKVTTENYNKAVDQVNAKFKRYEVHPVCGDLQGQILSCYKDNAGKTLNCSNIAALYLQCVNNAKQSDKRVRASSRNSNITS
ncbi:coiled-coil-helix-coiled-coil-helix domain containing 3a isoform X5 [Poecilia latipinna]|uniref:coiled-coil-helix-coiled-coil-helix domain containing 3a isoform X5 n=1 Tax=Poecilia latipinna TaxID=48699 RepID=UPI00072E5410|nr:PREDICTED: MICOS complex subunit MIC19 isoform X5 [Poecilia latipinna]XP_016533150.1 PREDICTED: MICOS complex subunit MIC19 isoform X5 [Poecilia formosa]